MVTKCTTCFNNRQLYILCYVFLIILSANSDCLLKQHFPIDLCNGDVSSCRHKITCLSSRLIISIFLKKSKFRCLHLKLSPLIALSAGLVGFAWEPANSKTIFLPAEIKCLSVSSTFFSFLLLFCYPS